MKLDTFLILALGALIVGCGGSTSNDPVAPGPDGESRVLALYTMTLSPAVTVSGQST